MEKGTAPAPTGKTRPGGTRRGKADQLTIAADRILAADAPAGSRFKGDENVIVQDLVLRRQVIRLRRERWLPPDGRTVIAPLPSGIVGHFGPVPRLAAQLAGLGIAISKRQIVRLPNAGQGDFLAEAQDGRRAGLSTAAPWPAPSRRPSAARTGSTALRSMDQRRRHRCPPPAPKTPSAPSSATTASPRSPPRPRRAG
jgi:hypothetical protein